jgi:predicted ATPase
MHVPGEDDEWQQLEPSQRRQRTLDAVKRLLLRESQVQPLIVMFEDLHWIDNETQMLLESLVESVPTARLLLLVNYRPEYQHGWSGKSYYHQLRIDPLPPESADELLTALLGEDPSVESLKLLLIERTEGNPFFLEQSVRTLIETKVLAGERAAYRLAKATQSFQIPATAHDSELSNPCDSPVDPSRPHRQACPGGQASPSSRGRYRQGCALYPPAGPR